MSESFRATPPEQQWSGANRAGNGNGFKNPFASAAPSGYTRSHGEAGTEVGKALLVGLLGGLLSAAGYIIYRRLPEDQKERLHQQVRAQVQQRVNEIRQNFNF
jgi:hypothetical protein